MRLLLNVGWISIGVALAVVGCGGGDTGGTSSAEPLHERTGVTRQALSTSFGVGTFIIPMDTTHQNNGMFRAYGLVYALLRANVPVSWVIADTGDNDIAIATGTTIHSRENGANIAAPENYRGGPFVVAPADHDAAAVVIDAWLAADVVTVVHEITAGAGFTANVSKTLTAAPSLAVFEDGFQTIAYDNLTAAGIRDSAGNAWSDASPGALSATDIAATDGDNADGKLLVSIGATKYPAFAFLSSEHYTTANDEVVAEVRSWLSSSSVTHAYMQCAAATSFENNAAAGTNPGGHFLTTNGLSNAGGVPNNPVVLIANDPLTQIDGDFTADTGTTHVMSLAAGSDFKTGVRTLIQQSGAAAGQTMLEIDGHLDGDATKGRVTYLAGHDYSTNVPVTGNQLANGSRLYFDAIFDSPAALPANQPNLVITLQAPVATNASTITYTITYTNNGGAPSLGTVITDPVPTGSTFGSADNGGTQAGGIVSWNIGPVAPGGMGVLTYTVNIAADAVLTNQATGSYKAWETPRTAKSNTTSTTRDTVAPDTTIVSGPPDTSTSNSATFDFSSDDPLATFECKLDSAADFTACPDPDVLVGLSNGSHTLQVRAKDAAGNTDPTPASKTWTVNSSSSTVDTDGDGIPDEIERKIGTDPNDADSDDDGVPDGMEVDFDKDTDGDGLINALDPDSDNDGLFDGTEMGMDCNNPATDKSKGHCIPDADHGLTKTNPLKRDTDNGGVSDGSEDANLNGMVDPGETDPTEGHGADDATVVDSDGDGLSDALEATLGSDPRDKDTDDDGVPDGLEPNPGVDSDGDGKKNILDSDSDNDGLFDGTEMGMACGEGTDLSKNQCIPDADNGATKTSPIDPDTDHGGVKDGDEDKNHNGKIDLGERDPNNAADDNAKSCQVNTDCAAGQICQNQLCVAGPSTGAGVTSPPNPDVLEGGGIDCSTSAPGTGSTSSSVLLLLAAAAVVSSRRRSSRRK